MFTCPICHAYNYRRIVVTTTRGPYETKFFECTGCSVMFLDPRTFSVGRTPKVALLPAREKQPRED
jgi:hypothetical protein